MPEKVLELKGVNAYYKEGKQKKQVLEDVSFTLYEGEITGLVGASGSGKSTLCKCVLGLLRDHSLYKIPPDDLSGPVPLPEPKEIDRLDSRGTIKSTGWVHERAAPGKGGRDVKTRTSSGGTIWSLSERTKRRTEAEGEHRPGFNYRHKIYSGR